MKRILFGGSCGGLGRTRRLITLHTSRWEYLLLQNETQSWITVDHIKSPKV
jgi:hypothetical protein